MADISINSGNDEEMDTTPPKSPCSSGSEDVDQPKIKRARADPDVVQEADDVDGSPEQARTESSANVENARSTRARKLKDPKEEPVSSPENDENRSPQEAAPKRKTAGRKRKMPRATEPALPSTSESGIDHLESTRISSRGRKSAHKRPSSSFTTLAIPEVENQTTVVAAGDNEVGQLGQKRESAARFAPIPGLEEKMVACAAGGMHSLLLSAEGNVFSFGCNDDGSLGRQTEDEDENQIPGKVPFVDAKIAKIAAGNIHSIALSTDCRAFIWGSYRDNNGAFGISPSNTTFVSSPMELAVPDRIVDVACGADHTLMLTAEGTMYSMGCAEHGRLGRIRKSHCCRENRRARQVMLLPLPVRLMRKRKLIHFNAIWAGRYNSFARNVEDNSIWGCGLNNFHQLGEVDENDHEDNFVYQPVPLKAFDPNIKWTQICGGEQHTLALDTGGTVYSMGRPLYGRLGLGKPGANDPDVVKLTPVPSLEERVVAIAAGDHCSFALDKDGQLWSWGQGTNMLGQSDRDGEEETDIFVPTLCIAKALKDKKVVSFGAGSNHTVCVVSE